MSPDYLQDDFSELFKQEVAKIPEPSEEQLKQSALLQNFDRQTVSPCNDRWMALLTCGTRSMGLASKTHFDVRLFSFTGTHRRLLFAQTHLIGADASRR
jgi:hypothetical protein